MDDKKMAYLQMIQEPIGRMSTASAIFKGFAATIVAGIAGLSYQEISAFVLGLSFIPVLSFFFLDLYYLKKEKQYRFLYEQVRLGIRAPDFSLDPIKDDKASKSQIVDCLASPSIWMFYPVMILVLVIVFIMKLKGNV